MHVFCIRSYTAYTMKFDIFQISPKNSIYVCKHLLFSKVYLTIRKNDWKISKVGIDQAQEQESMLIKKDGGTIGNLIKMWTVSDSITGKMLRDANRKVGDVREEIT